MHQQYQQMKRRAFTMIELVMVIVVLGIVSMIATDIISHMYKGYIQTKIINDLEQKTETLINQIASRLQYRIKDSMIARDSTTQNFLAMNSEDINSSSFNMVEWIGYDYESFLGEHNGTFSYPGWSGFIDVDHPNTNNTQVVTPGSDLTIVERTAGALSNGDINISNPAKQHPALIFKCAKGDANLSRYGWDYTVSNLADHNYTLAVSRSGTDILTFDTSQATRNICEQYYLAWSAYAIVPVGTNAEDFNLTLRYNYQPWYGERYDQNATSQLLAEHVSTFRVMQVGDTIRVKVCIQDGNITGEPVGFCKEKAVF
jgi:prepilin-type N-terminal cleavage/methylation domain-containing protein